MHCVLWVDPAFHNEHLHDCLPMIRLKPAFIQTHLFADTNRSDQILSALETSSATAPGIRDSVEKALAAQYPERLGIPLTAADIGRLDERNGRRRYRALQWLSSAKRPPSPSTVQLLLKAMALDGDVQVREFAARNMREISGPSREIFEQLVKTVSTDTSLEVQREAAKSLAVLSAGANAARMRSTVNLLKCMSKMPLRSLETDAVIALALIGLEKPAVRGAILEILRSEDYALASRAAAVEVVLAFRAAHADFDEAATTARQIHRPPCAKTRSRDVAG